MNYQLIGQIVLGAVIIAAWIIAGYCAFNRDYQRKRRAERDAELAALAALGKDSSNYRGIDFRA